MKKTEEADPVSDGNENDIRVLLHKVMAVILRVSRSAYLKTAAVDPHHYRFLSVGCLISLPDVQVQAILAHTIFDSRITRCLDRSFPIVIRLVNAIIMHNVHRCFPAQIADGLSTDKRNAFIGYDVLRLLPDKGAVDTLNSQCLVVTAASDPFVLADHNILLHDTSFLS